MAILNIDAAQQALKIDYLSGLQYQLNTANPILSVIERDSRSVVGEKVVMALRYGRQGGIGNRADDGDLPTPNSRKTKQAEWITKNIFSRIHISDKTIKASRNRTGAFVDLLEAELEDALNDARDNMARQVFGDGSGIMAACKVNSDTNTLEVDTVQFFAEGQLIDIVDNTNTVIAEGREILVVDDIDNKITISGAKVTTAATAVITITGNYDEELTGLKAVFTPNNKLYNIDRATHKWFNPTVINVNGEISEVIIQKALDEADRKAGGKVNFFSASYGVRRAYQNLLLATKQITNVMRLEGGWEALVYNGKPFTVDKYNPPNVLYGLDLSTWRLYHMGDWEWLDKDGAVLSRVPNKAVWDATLVRYCDLGCSKPKGNVKLYGITEH